MRMYPEPTGEVRMSLSLRFAAGSHKGMVSELSTHNLDVIEQTEPQEMSKPLSEKNADRKSVV